ncbi:MAG: FIST C-terminal domain-containing protein, partial [Gammaproteobacteria bacterium]|nr:FIST C-terminal domain-containing protein [Gammaproteobacteria bacterium]
ADLGTEPSSANFGLIYLTEPLAPYLDNLLEYLRKMTGVEDWVGTVGAGICCNDKEIYDEPAAAIMLATLPENSYRLIPSGLEALVRMLQKNRNWISEHTAHFGIVHGDPRNTHIAQLIESLAAELDPGFLVGGISSASNEDMQFQVAGEIHEYGLSGVLFSSQVPVISSVTQGCTPFGVRHRITECQGNIISELDDKPALDVFKDDIGEELANDLSQVSGYIFAGLPVSGSDTGDYLVRSLIGIDPDQKLLAIGENLEEEETIMFCKRDRDTAHEDMIRMLADLRKRCTGEIKGGVYYSCIGRGRNQFGRNSEELRLIHKQLGDFPLVGFFANGEISHDRLYGYTGVLTLFM